MKFYIKTLGCYKNSVDSEVLVSILENHYRFTKDYRFADIIIINTCSFIEKAKQESIESILYFARLKVGNESFEIHLLKM